ncbi:MAG: helix-turn-helix transcriptional regulator [Eubacteriaceae bacterium]
MHINNLSLMFSILIFLIFAFAFTQCITVFYYYIRSKDKILGMQALLNFFPMIILGAYIASLMMLAINIVPFDNIASLVFAIITASSMVITECCYIIYLLSLMPLSKKGYMRGTIICIGVSAILLANILIWIFMVKGFTAQVFMYVISYFLPITMFLVVICGILGFCLVVKVKDRVKRHHLKEYSTICMLFLPLIILDIIFNNSNLIIFTLAGFIGGSILSFSYFSKYFYSNYNSEVDEKNIEEFYKKNNISIREKDVIKLLLIGHSNPDIAKELYVSENTIKTHIKNIYKKLNINNRYQLINKIKIQKNN